MNNIDKLMAIEEIKQLKARYFRGVDSKDWELYRSVFADDVHMDISDDMPNGVFDDADQAVDAARQGLSGCQSIHHGHCPEIEIISDTTATGIWAMEDMLFWADDSDFPGQQLHGMGNYIEAYKKIEGRWLIRTMKLSRLKVNITTGE